MSLENMTLEIFLARQHLLASLAQVTMGLLLVSFQALVGIKFLLAPLARKGVCVQDVLTSKCPCSKDHRTFVALEVCSCVVFGTTSICLETSMAEVALERMGVRTLVSIQSIL